MKKTKITEKSLNVQQPQQRMEFMQSVKMIEAKINKIRQKINSVGGKNENK